VVAEAPDFAEGFALLAVADFAEIPSEPGNAALRDEADKSLKRALELDPRNGQAIDAKSFSLPWYAWKEREASNLRAASADPSYVHAPKQEGRQLWHLGRIRDGLVWLKRAHDLDPLEMTTSTSLAIMLASEGYTSESRSIRTDMAEQWPEGGLNNSIRFWTSLLLGETDTVLNLLSDSKTLPNGFNQEAANAWRTALTAKNLAEKTQPARARAIKVVTQAAQSGSLPHGHALLLLTQLGDIDGAFAEANVYEPTINGDIPFLFLSATKPLRNDPRFMKVAIRLGFVAYWRDTGVWPDFCREPALPYNCQAEVKRLEAADPTLKPLKVFDPKSVTQTQQ
jgi:tetratricopeptide (TPR) repeat protein